MTDLRALAGRVRRMAEHEELRCSVQKGRGCLTSISEATALTLLELYNEREEIAAALLERADRLDDA